MDAVEHTPTEPVDYAALNAAYGGLLATVVIAAATRRRDSELLRPSEIVPMGAATFALSKLIVNEKVVTWVRQPFVDEATEEHRPRGPPDALRRRRAAHVHALHRCVGRPRHRRPAPPEPARRPHCERRARRVGHERLPPCRVLVGVRGGEPRDEPAGRARFALGTARALDLCPAGE